MVDIMAQFMKVPSGLIMRRKPPEHHVFIANTGTDNPYDTNTRFTLNTGLYCDQVMKNRQPLLVRDAVSDPEWDQNPDIEHGMIFYLGQPLLWPDRSLFGTICVLDRKNNKWVIDCADLLEQFRFLVENDLRLLVEMKEREAAQYQLERAREELELRIYERTKELERANKALYDEVVVRRKTEKSLRKRESELQEVNAALKVLLQRDRDSKTEVEERIRANISELITPYLQKLKRRTTDEKSRTYLGLVENNINEIAAPFGARLIARFSNLTPTEIEIAKMVMRGMPTKTIAGTTNTEKSTVDFHRNNIRKKLGIGGSKVNLRAYLMSLTMDE